MKKTELKTYDAYKPSNVEWLRVIPAHWEFTRLGNLLFPIAERNRIDLPLLSITREKAIILRDLDNDDENHNFVPDDLSNYKVLLKGQFGMNKMKAWQGAYGVSNFDGIVSPAYFVFELSKAVDSSFFHWAIRSSKYINLLGSASDGVRIGQWDLSKERMKNILFFLPPKTEQAAIAKFLEAKIALIDTTISLKEKQIVLLKEHRQVVIHQLVTKGLNSHVTMKDSGIDWIGDVPDHWMVKKLKYIGLIINGFAFKSADFKSAGVRVMKISNIQTMEIDWTDESFVDEQFYKSLKSFQIKKGDLVFALTRPVISSGIKAALVDTCEKILLNQRNAVLKPLPGLSAKWMYYVLLNQRFVQAFEREIDKTGQQPNISTNNIGNLSIPLPTLKEQENITEKIDVENQKITSLITNEEKEIEKLKEYKASLIDSAVTGKIKVAR